MLIAGKSFSFHVQGGVEIRALKTPGNMAINFNDGAGVLVVDIQKIDVMPPVIQVEEKRQ